MSFTYVLSTDNGKVRLKLADTGGVAPGGTSTSYVFEDEEIAAFLTEGGSVDAAVGLGLKSLLADAARRTKHFALKGLSYDDRQQVSALKALLSMYGADMPTANVTFPALLPMDTDFTEPTVS